jgi:hypothetical protein
VAEEEAMAKGQMRSTREKKKPKQEKKEKAPSAYQQTYKAKPGAMPPMSAKKDS